MNKKKHQLIKEKKYYYKRLNERSESPYGIQVVVKKKYINN
jgi:hypothetical protein